MKRLFLFGGILLVCLLNLPKVLSITCIDDGGNPVDWFVAIKLPRSTSEEDMSSRYFLFTAKTKSWKLSQYALDGTGGAIVDTLSQAYQLKDKNKTVTLLYNDENPESEGSSMTYGHLKGVVAFDVANEGFWMIHSVPKFPGLKKYIYPDTGLRYGQHFLCVTFSPSWLPVIASQLTYAHPSVFSEHVPTWAGVQIPDLLLLANNKRKTLSTTSSMKSMKSLGGTSFLHFSKTDKFGRDLYDSFVAPGLRANLYMEGWINGRDTWSSTCGPTYRVYNVKEVQLEKYWWLTSNDHSKWVVTADKTNQWICFGDINRAASQTKRGGGTLCFQHPQLWSAFSGMVKEYEYCPKLNLRQRFHSLNIDIL